MKRPPKERESYIEHDLCQRVRAEGGIPCKFTSPNRRNVLDRACVMPGGITMFIECKAVGESLTPAQERELQRLQHMGHVAMWTNSIEMNKYIIDVWKRREEDDDEETTFTIT